MIQDSFVMGGDPKTPTNTTLFYKFCRFETYCKGTGGDVFYLDVAHPSFRYYQDGTFVEPVIGELDDDVHHIPPNSTMDGFVVLDF
jgi:hypothetical protein